MINKLFTVLFFLLFITSCINENEIYENGNQYQKIVNLFDADDQRLAFSSLEAEEKLLFWKEKFNRIRSLNKLNKEQIAFLEKIENHINISTFEDKSKESTVFKNYYTKVFDIESKKLFTEEQCYLFFYSFELKEDLTKEKINHRISEQYLYSSDSSRQTSRIQECNCNTSGCRRLTGLSLWGLEWENGECQGRTCWDDEWGCGFMGLYGCANLCVY